MPQNYVPIFIFAFVAFLVAAGTLALFTLVRPRKPNDIKLMPYECGITPFDDARGRYTVRFYIVAILFVVFDVETIFLFPWAVQFKLLGLFGLLGEAVSAGALAPSGGGKTESGPLVSSGIQCLSTSCRFCCLVEL